jgi:phage-related protein
MVVTNGVMVEVTVTSLVSNYVSEVVNYILSAVNGIMEIVSFGASVADKYSSLVNEKWVYFINGKHFIKYYNLINSITASNTSSALGLQK